MHEVVKAGESGVWDGRDQCLCCTGWERGGSPVYGVMKAGVSSAWGGKGRAAWCMG